MIECNICGITKFVSEFYRKQRTKCKKCFNHERKLKRKRSVCRHCNIEFIAGVEGRYKFCSITCRFMNKIKKDDSGCWLWQAHKNISGYGTFVPEGKRSGLAHRESYRIFKGEIDSSNYILHSCNIKTCVNPDHLKIGNAKENYIDLINSGGDLKRKLDTKDIIKIRKLYLIRVSICDIAKIFDVSSNMIYDIVKRRAWKHVE